MSKYHSRKATADGRVFDSKAERDFYLLCLLPLKQRGTIKKIVFQPSFELQPAFQKNSKRYRAICYIADFEVTYADGTTDVIDVKGFRTPVFRLKQKMFEYKYPKKTLKCVTNSRDFATFMERAILKEGKRNGKKES